MNEQKSLEPSYLEDTIGYHFQNKKYLLTALTHSSYANEGKHLQSNERLEFLEQRASGIFGRCGA